MCGFRNTSGASGRGAYPCGPGAVPCCVRKSVAGLIRHPVRHLGCDAGGLLSPPAEPKARFCRVERYPGPPGRCSRRPARPGRLPPAYSPRRSRPLCRRSSGTDRAGAPGWEVGPRLRRWPGRCSSGPRPGRRSAPASSRTSATAQAPAMVSPSTRRVGASVPRRNCRSSAGVRWRNMSFRLPATVISLTGSARAPLRIMKPAAPRL